MPGEPPNASTVSHRLLKFLLLFLCALLFSLGEEVECLHGLHKVEDLLFVIVESNAYALNLPDEFFEQFLLLSFVPVVGRLPWEH